MAKLKSAQAAIEDLERNGGLKVIKPPGWQILVAHTPAGDVHLATFPDHGAFGAVAMVVAEMWSESNPEATGDTRFELMPGKEPQVEANSLH